MKRFAKFVACACVILGLMMGCKDKQESQIQPKHDIFAYKLISTSTQDSTLTQSTQPPVQNFIIEVLDQPSERLVFYPTQNEHTNDVGKSIFEQPKPTIVLFVQDECKNCLTQTPYIIQLKEKYASQINLLILTAQPQTESANVDEILKSHHKTYPIYSPSDSQNLLEFLGKDISQGYLALFDQDGNKVIDYVGLVPPEMLERDILFLIHDTLGAPQTDTDSGTTESTQDSQSLESTQDNPEDTQIQDSSAKNP